MLGKAALGHLGARVRHGKGCAAACAEPLHHDGMMKRRSRRKIQPVQANRDRAARDPRHLPVRRADRRASAGQYLGWPSSTTESIYVADNGVHADLKLWAYAQGPNWPAGAAQRLRQCPGTAQWVALRRASGGSIWRRRPGRPQPQDRGDRADRRRAGDACRMGEAIPHMQPAPSA